MIDQKGIGVTWLTSEGDVVINGRFCVDAVFSREKLHAIRNDAELITLLAIFFPLLQP
jgi:hypothetical protein